MALLVLTVPVLPVQAQGGSGLIDGASFGLENGTVITNSSLSFSFEIHEVDGQDANLSVDLALRTLEGATVSSQTLPVTNLTAYEQRNVSVTLEGIGYGYHLVVVQLTGDVGQANLTHAESFSRVIQRLRPLNVTLGGPTSITVDGLTAAALPTGNLTIHDGDRFQVAFPVLNNGDFNWTGAVYANFTNGASIEEQVIETLRVNGSSAVQVVFTSEMTLVEGELGWTIDLVENLTGALGLHHAEGMFPVGPPPLPSIEAVLSSNSAEVAAGETLTVDVVYWNNGSAPFNGRAVCNVDGMEQLNETLALETGSNASLTFSLVAKPMVVECTTLGQRVSLASTLPGVLVIDLPSAVFESAGSADPSFSGGPWHAQDFIFGNMLLRNTGELEGRVRLVFEVDGVSAPGDWVVLSSGAAGEVTAHSRFLSKGPQILHWFLESDDGLVTGVTNGTHGFSVAAQQSVHLMISEVERDDDGSVRFLLALELDEGRAREVALQLGYETGDSTVYLREQTLLLEPGHTSQVVQFGALEGEQLVAQIAAVDWSIGPGPLAAKAALPAEGTDFWMEFEATTSPLRPVVGDAVTVTLTLHQSGQPVSEVGKVWIVDAYGAVLAEPEPAAWLDGRSEMSFEVVWPKGSTVSLQAHWAVDGQLLQEDIGYISGQVVVESGVDWPLGAIAWGAMLGAGLVLAARLRYRSQEASPSPKITSSNNASARSSGSQPSEEKREISCPECDRRLRVPVTYSGSVGCPDCSTKFSVEADVTDVRQPETDSSDGSVSTVPAPAKNDGKIEVGCPDCQQTLRIPSSYQGSVRCPACTKIFKANEALTILE